MKRLKNGLVSSASLSFIGSLTYMIISGLIGGIFEKTLSETVIIHWIFIYIPLIAATIFFFRLRGTVDKKNTNDDISLSRCLPIWMISFPFASFIVSRPYGSLVSFAKSGNTPFSDYLYKLAWSRKLFSFPTKRIFEAELKHVLNMMMIVTLMLLCNTKHLKARVTVTFNTFNVVNYLLVQSERTCERMSP